MALTSAQKTALKADIAANTNTIGGVQIKNLPNNDDANFAIALWYSTQADCLNKQDININIRTLYGEK